MGVWMLGLQNKNRTWETFSPWHHQFLSSLEQTEPPGIRRRHEFSKRNLGRKAQRCPNSNTHELFGKESRKRGKEAALPTDSLFLTFPPDFLSVPIKIPATSWG